MSFGTNLQFLRDRAGMTQEELAEQLQVSRQSVSKWESDTSFPEMEKLLVLCEIFHTDLDTLLRGDVRESYQTDAAGYDRFMNWFSNCVALGVGLILLALSLGMGLVGWFGAPEVVIPAVLLTGVAVAVTLFVVAGIRYDRFEKEHPVLQDFYAKEQRERFLERFPLLIALPIAAILVGVVWLVLLGEAAERKGELAELSLTAGFLFIVACAVTVLVWTGLRRSKYDIEGWNKEHDPSPEAVALRKKESWICGAIMIGATVLYLIVGFGAMAMAGDYGNDWGWRWGWIVYPVAGTLCLLVSHLLHKGEE
nr:helix-turn-helix transcriptional regulator [uncultured Flavonifractor sp.]